MQILFYLLACILVSQCKITIKDSGVATLSRGDVGLIFYITLENVGNCRYHVVVQMVKCCETFGLNDMDCQLMNLMGGDMGLLYPNVTKNISLLYPNMYLHNRKGQCVISIKYASEKNYTFELKERISFDTFICENRVTPVLRGYYSKREYTKCKTVDQDPLDNCEPINCHMKYLGCRNYFNHKWKRCQKVPICIADPDKDLPDVSYLPVSNTCRDLEDIISVQDLKHLEKGLEAGCWNNPLIPYLTANLRCHHGTLNNETGYCVCDDGWISVPLDKDQYEPTLSVYHMCNIEIGTWNAVNSTKVKMTALVIAVIGALFTVCTLAASFCCHFLYKCIMERFSQSTDQDELSVHEEENITTTEKTKMLEYTEQAETTKTHSNKISLKPDSEVIMQVSKKKSLESLPVIEETSETAEFNEDTTTETEEQTTVEQTEQT